MTDVARGNGNPGGSGASALRLAAAIQRHVTRQAEALQRPLVQATVVTVAPLEVELFAGQIRLIEDDLRLSDHMRHYAASRKFEVHDTLILQQLPDHRFLVVGALSDREMLPVHDTAILWYDTPLVTDHGTILGYVETYDTTDGSATQGEKRGCVLVYDPDTLTDGVFHAAVPDASGDPTWSGTDPQGGTVTVTASRHIVSKVAFYNADGTIRGYVPIYSTLP